MDDRQDRIVVIGAGFAGLSAAVRLATAGRKVIVLEAAGHGGGRARSFADRRFGMELDNGQHMMMSCYRDTLAFLRQIGTDDGVYFQRNLEVNMVRSGGRRVSLVCPALPAPFHLAAGLLRMRGLGVLHKASALRAGLLLRGEVDRPDDNETCDMWLRRMGQTQGIRSAFWDPLIWAVLNDDPLIGSAAMLMSVIERAFMGTRDASCLGVPRLPLSRLYVTSAIDYLQEHGAEILLRSPARKLIVRDDVVRGVALRSGDEIEARTVISAVPPKACLDILPERARAHPVFQDVAQLKMSPIINLWVFTDRPLFSDVPFLGLMDSPIHWLFDRNHIEGRPHTGGVLLGCTISGARSLIDDSQDALMSLFAAEMRRFFPDRRFQVQGFRVLKERRATISHSAGTNQQRPPTRSPIHGLYLAGDWVRTGLPATIESACQSGHDAAAAILEG